MATIFNSRIAKRIIAEEKTPDFDPTPAAQRLYTQSDKKYRTEPHFSDGRSVRSFIDNLLSGDEPLTDKLGQNRGVLETMLKVLALSGPDAQAEKRKDHSNDRTASRLLFNASQYNDDGSLNWNNIAEPDDLATQDELHAATDATNLGRGDSGLADDRSIMKTLRQYGITDTNMITRIPDLGILLPSMDVKDDDEHGRVKLIKMPEPAKGSKVPCSDPDCPHDTYNLMKEMKWTTGLQQSQRCDADNMVCAECHNLPMVKGSKPCPTCDRKGTLNADEAKSYPNVYDPDKISIGSGITDMVSQGISAPPQAYSPEPSDDIIASVKDEFGSVPRGETDYMAGIDALAQIKERNRTNPDARITEAGGLDSPAAYESEHLDNDIKPSDYVPEESDDPTTSDEPRVVPADRFVGAPGPQVALQDHEGKCSFGCNSGSLIGSTSVKAIQRIKDINRSEERLGAIEKTRKAIAKDKRIPKGNRAAYEKRAIDTINQQYYQCPELGTDAG